MDESASFKMEDIAAQAMIQPGSMILKLNLYLRPLGGDNEHQHIPAQTPRPECRFNAISSRNEQRYCSQSGFSRRVGIFEQILNESLQVIVGAVCVKFPHN
jgi:hypothetical protein